MEYSNLRLDYQLCFALYNATQAIIGAYRPRLAAAGITYEQFLVLTVLWEKPEQDAAALDARLRFGADQLLALLEQLNTSGLLEIDGERSGLDSTSARLTAEGLNLRDRIAAAQSEVAACTGLSDGPFARLREELHELASEIRRRDGLDRD